MATRKNTSPSRPRRGNPKTEEPVKLRCKPGDWAMITREVDYLGRDLGAKGIILRVLSVFPHETHGNPCWSYEGRRKQLPSGWQLDGVADSSLTPLPPLASEEELADATVNNQRKKRSGSTAKPVRTGEVTRG